MSNHIELERALQLAGGLVKQIAGPTILTAVLSHRLGAGLEDLHS